MKTTNFWRTFRLDPTGRFISTLLAWGPITNSIGVGKGYRGGSPTTTWAIGNLRKPGANFVIHGPIRTKFGIRFLQPHSSTPRPIKVPTWAPPSWKTTRFSTCSDLDPICRGPGRGLAVDIPANILALRPAAYPPGLMGWGVTPRPPYRLGPKCSSLRSRIIARSARGATTIRHGGPPRPWSVTAPPRPHNGADDTIHVAPLDSLIPFEHSIQADRPFRPPLSIKTTLQYNSLTTLHQLPVVPLPPTTGRCHNLGLPSSNKFPTRPGTDGAASKLPSREENSFSGFLDGLALSRRGNGTPFNEKRIMRRARPRARTCKTSLSGIHND